MALGSRWLRRAVAVAALAAFLPLAGVGCFGRFELTRKVYRFNQDVSDDKWIDWVFFLVMNFVPIYGFAAAIDALFANSVEFWTGDNPIRTSDAGTRTAVGPDGEIARATPRADGGLDLELIAPDGDTQHLVLVRRPGLLEARDPDGRLLARVLDVDGAPRLFAPR